MKLEEGRTVMEGRMRLEQENLRLRHRVAYLEETVGDLQGAMDRARQSLVVMDMGSTGSMVSSSSSGVSSDSYGGHGGQPPPKPARQFIERSNYNQEVLYANNNTYEEINKNNSNLASVQY